MYHEEVTVKNGQSVVDGGRRDFLLLDHSQAFI